MKLHLFNLDSTYILPDIEGKSDFKDILRIIKIIVGSEIGCITALAFSIITMLYLHRRYENSEQEVKDEVVPLR